MPPSPSRRDFFRGLSGAASQPAPGSEEQPAAESLLLHISRRAMASEFEICLNAGQYENGTEVAIEALNLLEPLESQMSVFRPESEISRINLLAAERPVEVEPRLFELLKLAMGLCRATDGAYDITAGPLWEVWGFARRAGAVPSEEQIAEARSRVGRHLVELDHKQRTIHFRRPGVKINLGSIGKGFAVHRCAEILLAGGISDFLLHGGNSSVLARGARTPHAPREGASSIPPLPAPPHADHESIVPGEEYPGWTVGIRDPLHPDRRLAQLRLHNRALGTSGSQFQSFRHQGRRYGHILDPRTGWPAEGVLSATVLAPTAAVADALSTAFYVLGPLAALDYCRQHPDIAAVLVCPAKTGHGWEIHSAGVEDFQLRS
jgi:thiamine biosynthesis lipoprotein